MSQAGAKYLTRRRLLWVVGAGAASATAGYALYQYALKDYLHRQWAALSGTTSSACRVLEALGAASELSASVAADLKAFLESDSDEIPRSVRQALKLSGSEEFRQAVLRSTQAITEGVCLGLAPAADGGAVEGSAGSTSGRRAGKGKGFVETVMQQLFSDEGKSFASAVCSRVVRTLASSLQGSSVQLLSSALVAGSPAGSSRGSAGKAQLGSCASAGQQKPWLVVLFELLATEKGKELVAVAVRSFAVNGVGTYLDKLGEGNMYHDLLSAVSTHQEAVKEVGAHVVTATVREVVCSWRGGSGKSQRTAPARDCASESSSSSSSSSSPRAAGIPMSTFSDSETQSEIQAGAREPAKSTAAEVAGFLAQPSIRKLILDLTAVTTTRGMEAFLLVLFSKLFRSPFSTSTSSPILVLKEVPSCGSSSPSRDCSKGSSSAGVASAVCAKAAAAVCVPSSDVHLGGGLLTWGSSKALASRSLATTSVCLAVMLHHMTM